MHARFVAGIIAALAISSVFGAEQQWQHFEVPGKDVAKAEELANQLASLSRRVDPNEATLVAQCAFSTVARLRQEYRMFEIGRASCRERVEIWVVAESLKNRYNRYVNIVCVV